MPPVELSALESQIGHRFKHPDLLVRALTHKSKSNDQTSPTPGANCDNEQLEFLGDAILGFLASDLLVTRFPDLPEGRLSKLKSHVVSASRLYKVALQLDLGRYLVLGKGEELSGGRSKRGLLADAVEAVLAAMYLDAGLEVCRRFVEKCVVGETDLFEVEQGPDTLDAKSALQEHALARCIAPPRYAVLREEGPQHAKRFTVEVRLAGGLTADGQGASKKAASQQAARHLLARLLAQGPPGDGG